MPISRLRPMRYTWLYPVSSSVSMCIMRRVITKYLIFLYCFSYISNIFYFVPQMDEICSVFQFSVVIQHNCQVHRVPEIKTTTKCLAACLVDITNLTTHTRHHKEGGGEDRARGRRGNLPQCLVSRKINLGNVYIYLILVIWWEMLALWTLNQFKHVGREK